MSATGRDDPPMTVEHLTEIAYDYYCRFYAEPRAISYMELAQQVGANNVRVLDYVAEALNRGVAHSECGRPRFDKEELLDLIGRPHEDPWELAEPPVDVEGDAP